jgi:hypothetical protein
MAVAHGKPAFVNSEAMALISVLPAFRHWVLFQDTGSTLVRHGRASDYLAVPASYDVAPDYIRLPSYVRHERRVVVVQRVRLR